MFYIMSIQQCIENVKGKKMDPYVRDGDINDVNMELIIITNHLSKTQKNRCIYVPKILYFNKRCYDIDDDSSDSDSDCSIDTGSDSDSSEFDETVLTFEFPYYGHIVKNVKMIQKNGKMNIIKCQMKTKRSNITLFESTSNESVNLVELVTNDQLLPIVNLLNDTVQVKVWTTSSRDSYDYELHHDIYFYKDDKLAEIRNINSFEFNGNTYETRNGKIKQ